MELEQKDKQIQKLEREIDCLKLQIQEYRETVSQLCVQMNHLFLKQKENAN
jgi:predicted RNase H-like nuclease (RuvC/YqgF family)